MRVALWVPKYNVSFDDPCCYPLGFMYISAELKRLDHNVTVFNNNLGEQNPQELFLFDAVLFTGFEEFMPENIRLSDQLRDRGVKTILGGAYATFCTDDATKHFDSVVIGEGETSIQAALDCCGVFSGKVDINNAALPDYEGFGIDEYHKRHRTRYMGVLTSRGCPYSCTFCSHTCNFACRDMESVFDEIDMYINKYKLDVVIVNDNTLNVRKDRFVQFCKMMTTRKVKWSAALRLDNIDDACIKLAKDSGLIYSVVGVESFNQLKLDEMKKNISVNQIENGLNLLQKYSIAYTGNVLVGSIKEIVDNWANIKKYGLYPTGIKKFVGNHVQDAPAEVHDFCRSYAISMGRTYAA